MSYPKLSMALFILSAAPLSAFGKDVNTELKLCASHAMQAQSTSPQYSYSVEEEYSKEQLNQSSSKFNSVYYIQLTRKTSGEEVGKYACTLSPEGEVLSTSLI